MVSELGGAALHGGLQTRGPAGPPRAAEPEQIRATMHADGSFHTPRTSVRRDREHAQQRRRHGLAARRAARGRRDGARARALRLHLDGARLLNAARRARRAGGGDRRAVRHGDALPLEGSRLPARRADRRLARADAPRPASRSTASAARCARRGSSPRPASTRSTTTSSGSPRTTRARAGLPRPGPPPACRSTSSACSRTSCRSTSRRSGSASGRRSTRLREAGVALSRTMRPGVLRAVTHLDLTDDDVERALELVPSALGGRVHA